jgi:hypothetical protein
LAAPEARVTDHILHLTRRHSLLQRDHWIQQILTKSAANPAKLAAFLGRAPENAWCVGGKYCREIAIVFVWDPIISSK